MKTSVNAKKSKKSSILWLIVVAFITVSLLLFCQFYFGNAINSKSTFYPNTFINGVNVSGLTKSEASNILQENLLSNKNNLNITLKADDKSWTINGADLNYVGNFNSTLDEVMEYGHQGNIFEQKKYSNKIKKEGLYVDIPIEEIYDGFDGKIESIISEIEVLPQEGKIDFNPDSANMFSITPAHKGIVINRDELKKTLSQAIKENNFDIEIPFVEILPENNLQSLLSQIKLRSSFSTDYSRSTSERKYNIKTALSKFNGMIVEPEQEVSFNSTTGARTKDNGYKTAKIIVGGKYVDGVGGGVCQASTTLYNALILAGVDIVQVNHHTLPASYVPLSFDAMVSEGYADLVFKNTLETPIFIKTICDDKNITVEIYGQPFEDGVSLKTRAELVKIIPHGGDDIIKDVNNEYGDKVLYQGEYYRLKFPQEGYESKGYIQTIKNGEVIEEKEIRHDKYMPQNGIIVEGNYTLEEGMTLPANNVKYIPPQKVTEESEKNAKLKWKMN